MADNPDRFVIIDGVQYSRERATRLGLLKSETPDGEQHVETRARTSTSARTPGSGGTRARGKAPATAVVGDGAASTGEDAKRAGAAEPQTPPPGENPPAGDGNEAGENPPAGDGDAAGQNAGD